MKFYKAFLVLSFFLAYSCDSFASISYQNELETNTFLDSNKVINNKIYVETSMVYVSPHQIFLNVEGQLLPVESLSTDEFGVFVTVEGITSAVNNKNGGTWKCGYCKRVNLSEDKWCKRCLKDPQGNLCK